MKQEVANVIQQLVAEQSNGLDKIKLLISGTMTVIFCILGIRYLILGILDKCTVYNEE